MSVTNIVRAVVKPGSNYTVTSPIMKEDKGQVLLIEGLDLPEVYEIDFSNDRHDGSSITMIGNADGVLIPTQFIKTGRDVYAFYYYVGDNFGQTEHVFRLPNDYRPDRTDEVPEPEQESLIEQAITALNEAVESTQEAQQAIEDMTVSAQTLAEGSSATVTKSEQDGVVHLEFGIPRGADGSGGGGGGTGDYNDLSNKPSINGNVLSGNKTAAQLGLATPSDIPTVPVQSVNGKIGAVVLGASDVGALPAGTAIPSKTSDLTNDSGFQFVGCIFAPKAVAIRAH